MSISPDLHAIFPYLQQDETSKTQLVGILSQFYNQKLTINNIRFFDSKNDTPLRTSSVVNNHFNKLLGMRQTENFGYTSSGMDMFQLTSSINRILADLHKTGCFDRVVIKPKVNPSNNTADLHVYVKRKSNYHISFDQTFNKEGNISLSYTGGLRNVLGCFETWNFSYQKSLQKFKLSQKQFNVSFPLFWNNTKLDASYFDGSTTIDDKIIERKVAQDIQITFPFKGLHTGIKKEWRSNMFDPDDVSLDVLMNEILPTRVIKAYMGMNLFSSGPKSVLKTDADFKIEKCFGDAQYLGLNFSLQNALNLQPFLKKLSTKEKFTNLLLSNNFKFDYLYQSNPDKLAKLNDLKHFLMPRGYDVIGNRKPAYNSDKHPHHSTMNFKHLGTHKGGDFTFQNSTKLYFQSFPYLKNLSQLSTFLHYSVFHTTLHKANRFSLRNKDIRKSAGIGVNFNAGLANVEFLYNFWHSCTKFDKPNHFQIKFSIGD